MVGGIGMTLEEATKHCEEKACGNSECALEHKQLAEWLKELQALRKNKIYREKIMKTIEERAIEYASHSYIEDGNINTYIDESEKQSYIQGAMEQKAIDIEKICDWLKENAWSFAHSFDGEPYYDTEMMIDALRKAMEE